MKILIIQLFLTILIVDSLQTYKAPEFSEKELIRFETKTPEENGSPGDTKNDTLSDYQVAIWVLKAQEGLHYNAYWDYKQFTIGFGTKAEGKDDTINYAGANMATKVDYQKRFNSIARRYPKLTRFQQLIVTNFEYNTPIGKKLHAALQAGDIPKVKYMMLKYVHAGGAKLKGLEARRALETKLLTATKAERQKIGMTAQKLLLAHIEKAAND